MKRSLLALAALGVLASGAAGCGDDPKPGTITWSVKHHNALAVGPDSQTDLKGDLYVCLFKKNPFTNKGTDVVEFQRGYVEMQLPETTQPGTFAGVDKGTYVLLFMLDDDSSNALKECVDRTTGEVVVSDRDPISLVTGVEVEPELATEVATAFDHRKIERI